MKIPSIVEKALDDGCLANDEIAALFETPLFSDESARIIAAGRGKAGQACSGWAEVHAQVGLNVARCPMNCRFCSFAACNEVFEQASELSTAEAVDRARRAETEGANALYLMITADYPFTKYLDVASAVRQSLRPETPMVANIGDLSLRQAQQLKQTGFAGIYHAVRLGEGRDTSIPVERRLQTMEYAREAGLLIGTCLEPVGPEHTTAELVAKTVITREARPVYSGAARRIPIAGTEMAKLGIVSKARMAHLVAVKPGKGVRTLFIGFARWDSRNQKADVAVAFLGGPLPHAKDILQGNLVAQAAEVVVGIAVAHGWAPERVWIKVLRGSGTRRGFAAATTRPCGPRFGRRPATGSGGQIVDLSRPPP